MDEKIAKKIASDIYSYVENAAGEIAANDIDGDAIFNDADAMEDLTGDQVHWKANGNAEDMLDILNALDKIAHPALRLAVSRIRGRTRRRIRA